MMHERGTRSIRGKISIEDLLTWAFQTEAANLHDESFLDVTARYPEDSIVRSERANVLGGFIQGTGPGARMFATNTADDAELVAEAVGRLRPKGIAVAVASHAKAGNRPDWRPYAQHRWTAAVWIDEDAGDPYASSETVPPWEMVDAEGRERPWKPYTMWDPAKRRNVRVPWPRWCRIVEIDAPATIMAQRQAYSEWRAALDELRHVLEDRLDRWRVNNVLPPAAPWRRKS